MAKGYSLYLYGSTSRGDIGKNSDVDLLAVVGQHRLIKSNSIDIPDIYATGITHSDLCVYSASRLEGMFEEGHLFAWHLYLESKHIEVGEDVLAGYGAPKAYDNYYQDVVPLLKILETIGDELELYPANKIYEAGLLYVCLRNIAMSSSYFSPGGLTFSAYAPFRLGYSDNRFPLNSDEYEMLRQSRLSSTRGVEQPNIGERDLKHMIYHSTRWAKLEYQRRIGECYEKAV